MVKQQVFIFLSISRYAKNEVIRRIVASIVSDFSAKPSLPKGNQLSKFQLIRVNRFVGVIEQTD